MISIKGYFKDRIELTSGKVKMGVIYSTENLNFFFLTSKRLDCVCYGESIQLWGVRRFWKIIFWFSWLSMNVLLIEEFNCVHLWDVMLWEGIETQVLSNLQLTTLFLFVSTLEEVYRL